MDNELIKIFISLPTSDKSNLQIKAQIKKEAKKAKYEVESRYFKLEPEIIILNNIISEDLYRDIKGDKSILHLSKSLELLAKADVVYFSDNWNLDRECIMEYDCAVRYGKEIIHAPCSEKHKFLGCMVQSGLQEFEGRVYYSYIKICHGNNMNELITSFCIENNISVDNGLKKKGGGSYSFWGFPIMFIPLPSDIYPNKHAMFDFKTITALTIHAEGNPFK